jgi:hypothetical protein
MNKFAADRGIPLPDVISTLRREQDLTQWHLPFHNYAGPGTRVFTNILTGVKPTNYLDRVAQEHDVNYTDGTMTQLEADNIMIKKVPLPYLPELFLLNRIFNFGKKTTYPVTVVNYMRDQLV